MRKGIVLEAEIITKLKHQPGPDLHFYGSANLVVINAEEELSTK